MCLLMDLQVSFTNWKLRFWGNCDTYDIDLMLHQLALETCKGFRCFGAKTNSGNDINMLGEQKKNKKHDNAFKNQSQKKSNAPPQTLMWLCYVPSPVFICCCFTVSSKISKQLRNKQTQICCGKNNTSTTSAPPLPSLFNTLCTPLGQERNRSSLGP